jgi:uncharacterized protein (DUF2336 family)
MATGGKASAARPGPAGGIDLDDLSYLFDQPDSAASSAAPVAEFGDEPFPLNEKEVIDLSGSDSVRATLASRLGKLLPSLHRERRDRVFDQTCLALERLAHDQAVIVRVALASAIKDVACAPPAVCLRLAQDVEASVAEPILRCCAGLTDGDLLSLLRGKPPSWALAAIAGRKQVSGPLSTALYQADDVTAIGVLLDNSGAEIPEDTLTDIVEDARQRPEWQGKLVRRPILPRRLALRLAAFVDQAALELLRGREDLDAATAREVVRVARRRIEWLQDTVTGEGPDRRALRLYRRGTLDEAALEDALSWKQYDFVRAALALRAGIPPLLVDKILQSRSGRAVTALAWRADLTMRTAFTLQKELAGLPASQFVYPREGAGYPMTAEEMTWQLEFFGIPSQHPS